MDAYSFPNCGGAAQSFSVLKGTRLIPGWSRWLKEDFRGKAGCTHVLELFPVIATTVYQSMWDSLKEKYPHHIPAR